MNYVIAGCSLFFVLRDRISQTLNLYTTLTANSHTTELLLRKCADERSSSKDAPRNITEGCGLKEVHHRDYQIRACEH